MRLKLASSQPCLQLAQRLRRETFTLARHRHTDQESHKRAAVAYVLDGLKGITKSNHGESTVRIDPVTSAITCKCGDPECTSYVSATSLTRTKVFIEVDDDNPRKPQPAKMLIQVERDLCPHCFVLSSRAGTQKYDPSPREFTRSTAKLRLPVPVFRNGQMSDKRLSSEIDSEGFAETRSRYR